DLGIIPEEDASRRLSRILTAVERLERVHGFFYDKIDPRTGKPLRNSPCNNQPIAQIVSCVDNGWLAPALMMIRNSCPALPDRADGLAGPMDFGFFYVPFDPADPRAHPGLMHGPFSVDRKTWGGVHRILNTEQRIAA